MNSYRVILLVAAASLLAGTAAAFEPLFDTRLDFPVDSFPQAIVSADLDHDGNLDLAVANWGANTVSILKGNGDRTFQLAVSYPVGKRPFSICVGDFNNDGCADLAVADSRSDSVSILMNNGDGTFAPAFNLAVGSFPYCVIAADLDGDGWVDLAVANFGSNSVTILRNVTHITSPGRPSFLDPVSYTVGTGPYSLVAANIYANDDLDLAVANYGANTVSILKNLGTAATFKLKDSIVGLNHPISICAADFDADGAADLAVADYFSKRRDSTATIPPDTVLVFRNAGSGRFTKFGAYAVGSYPSSVTAADFNGDLFPDLAVTNFASHTISLLLNRQDGRFNTGLGHKTGSYPCASVGEDFDRDGKRDLAVVNTGAGTVSVLKGNGDGTFDSRVVSDYATSSGPLDITPADLNGDGAPEIVTANMSSNLISVLDNVGDGTFRPAVTHTVGLNPVAICAADFNGNGFTDLAVANSGDGTASVLLDSISGAFRTPLTFSTGTTPYDIVASDLNGDGRPDLAVVNNGSGTVSVILNTGGGNFASPVNYQVGTFPTAVRAADFNGDGATDLVVAHRGNLQISIMAGTRGIGEGTFNVTTRDADSGGPTALCVADFDGDGKPDLALARYDSNYVAIMKNTGSSFSLVNKLPVGHYPIKVVPIYLESGRASLAVANWGSDDITVLRNDGHGNFTDAGSYGVGRQVVSLCTDDLNRDGRPDLAIANRGTSTVSVLLNVSQLPTDVRDWPTRTIPEGFALQQNYPNPFNLSTTISFDLPSASTVNLEVFNVLGQHVRTLVDERLAPGHKLVTWDGTDASGRVVASGVYLYRLRTDSYVEARKMMLIK